MSQKLLTKTLHEGQEFVVCVELTGGPNYNMMPVEAFLKDFDEMGRDAMPEGFNFCAVTFPQNPGGAANIDPAHAYYTLQSKGLLEHMDYIPHVTCKDHNASAIASTLATYQQAGIDCVLVMTGDRPVGSKPVFELDSVGALQLVSRMNQEAYLKANPKQLDEVHQFYPAAAVSPFKYTPGSLMQQYFKMEKKIAAGARLFMTQVGWDWKKSQELFWYMRDEGMDVPVLGNVYLLSTQSPAPRLMHDVKLAGCFVSDALLSKVMSESVEDHMERAAQQVAMYRAMGAAGVDLAGVHHFAQLQYILNRAAEIGDQWEQYKDNLCWPADEAFYLYDSRGQRTVVTSTKKGVKQVFFDVTHRALLDPAHHGFHVFKKTMGLLGGGKEKGFTYKTFNATEKGLKYLMFECQECGDCFLPENFGYCSLGGCKKGLSNAPCGDATVDGHCGNDLNRVCVGERIYQAASAQKGGVERLRTQIHKPRNANLTHSSSILNYLFSRDHTMKNAIISIGESVHASIPKTGEVMKQLKALGDDAYVTPSAPLNYIRALIETQADDGADYIAVNLDAFGDEDMQVTAEMMVQYVTLVRQWGKGVPICIDSGHDDVLIAGLKAWYDTDESVKTPLVNSVKTFTVGRILPLRSQYDFSFIGLLVGEDITSAGPGGSYSVEQLYGMAKDIFEQATSKYGFKPEQMFFDSTVFPLAIDMPMEPNVPGYTYRAFETIKKIKSDPKMKGVHCSLGVSNSVRDLPARRIGICRAYVAVGMEYGLDAGIVNVAHHYGAVEPAPELVALVKAYAQIGWQCR